MLYQIDDLRIAVETAKRLLTKDKIDKQKTGHSSVSPFMNVSQEDPKKNEKGVTFSAMDTMKRHSDSIDKLTSLVNKLDMKLGRREAQYRPKIYQGRNRGCMDRDRTDIGLEIDPAVETMVNIITTIVGEEEIIIIAITMIEVIDSNCRDSSRSRNRGRNKRYDNRPNYRRDIFRENYGNQGYRNRSVSQECDRSWPRYRSNSRDSSRYRYNREQSRSRDREQRSKTVSRDRGK